ncbi:hypothetical protein DICPUDRAFT_79306 [Dictyostelium purpureum]|uniref:Uncharacterized protein n=1 Tax=Dictyostelium purpureum TaxID=5786 RepID=F0ZM69_DICPU|nr:uncharacterized protein DICPUDRAFT_79306 [Dictyostelium purpureum]EGC34978.1 hypothetical protein DICPUDRAFT_79306 [Dictyostelium purpureum]|eukprot:XP_003288503.1 hypothetical protein DICPUDRAFT_79306 [Dictyostelium purpureum]
MSNGSNIIPCLNSLIKDTNININNQNNQNFIESLIKFSNIVTIKDNTSEIEIDYVLNIILNYFKTDFYIDNPFFFDSFIDFLKTTSNFNFYNFLKSILVLNIPPNFQYYFIDRLIEYNNNVNNNNGNNNVLPEDSLLKEILNKNKNDKIVLNKLIGFGRFKNNSSNNSNTFNGNEESLIFGTINLITPKEILDRAIRGINEIYSLDYLNQEHDYIDLVYCIQDHPSFKEMLHFLKSNFDHSVIEWLNMDLEILNQYYQHYNDDRLISNKFNFYSRCIHLYISFSK